MISKVIKGIVAAGALLVCQALPVTASYTINPYAHTSYLNAGVGIRF